MVFTTLKIAEGHRGQGSATRGKYLIQRRQEQSDDSMKKSNNFVYKEDLHILVDTHELTYMLEVQ